MYFLYIGLIGLYIMNGMNGITGINGFSCNVQSMNRMQNRGIIQMRAKRTKATHDVGGSDTDIIAGLAAGGGGSRNYRALSPVYTPRTPNQKTYVTYLREPETKIVLGVGSAGSGKTLFACYTAIQELRKGTVSKIIMTRPVVPVDEEEIGFLPGSLINKMDPWTRPIFDILLEFYTQKDIDAMLHGGVIEISPLAYMRGRTFKHAFIIADEMQNSSPNQMLMLTTRIGDGSKMVITGDLKQSDRGMENGLSDLLRKVKLYDTYKNKDIETDVTMANAKEKHRAIHYVELDTEDVQRSAIVKQIVDIYNGIPPPGPAPGLRTTEDDSALIPIHHISKRMKTRTDKQT